MITVKEYVTALLEYLDIEMCKDCALMVMHPVKHSPTYSSAMFKCTANTFTLTLGHSVSVSIMKYVVHSRDQ